MPYAVEIATDVILKSFYTASWYLTVFDYCDRCSFQCSFSTASFVLGHALIDEHGMLVKIVNPSTSGT